MSLLAGQLSSLFPRSPPRSFSGRGNTTLLRCFLAARRGERDESWAVGGRGLFSRGTMQNRQCKSFFGGFKRPGEVLAAWHLSYPGKVLSIGYLFSRVTLWNKLIVAQKLGNHFIKSQGTNMICSTLLCQIKQTVWPTTAPLIGHGWSPCRI